MKIKTFEEKKTILIFRYKILFVVHIFGFCLHLRFWRDFLKFHLAHHSIS